MQSIHQKYNTKKSLGNPLDQIVDVTATKVVRVKDGIIEYCRHASPERVSMASTLLVGLVQAAHGVRLDEEGWPHELETGEEGPGSTILSLYLAHSQAKAQGKDALKKFCDAFHKAHKKYLRRSVHSVDQWSYYTSSVDAGRVKQPGDSSVTTTFLDRDGGEVEKFNIDWARDINDIFPSELLPDSWYNVLRGFGAEASGVTAPMAFIGGMMHLFHVHFEETGVAAANARVLFQEPLSGTSSSSNIRLAKLSPKPATTRREFQRFWSLHQEGIDGIEAIIKALKEENKPRLLKRPLSGLDKSTGIYNEPCFPIEFIGMFNDLGYKEWLMWNGNSSQTVALAHHARDVLGLDPSAAPGISVLQHFDIPRRNGSHHMSIDPDLLPDHLGSKREGLWDTCMQTDGDVVYTDTRLHLGWGFLSFNTAFNILPMSLFQRTSRELGLCNPVVFNEVSSDFAFEEAKTSTANKGQRDSTSECLFQLLFDMVVNEKTCNVMKSAFFCDAAVDDEDQADLVRAKNDFDTMVAVLDAVRLMHVKFCDEHHSPLFSITELCTSMSPQYALRLHRVCRLCTSCGRARALSAGWVPVDKGIVQEHKDPVWLCHKCGGERNVAHVLVDYLDVGARRAD